MDITFPDVLTGDVYRRLEERQHVRPADPRRGQHRLPRCPRGRRRITTTRSISAQLTDTSIVDNAAIIARGYNKAAGGINAFWISVGP